MQKIIFPIKAILFPVTIGILVAAVLFIITCFLGKYSGNIIFYYAILLLIGPPILTNLITNLGFIYGVVLCGYFIGLCIVFRLSNNKKQKIAILVIAILLHLFSVLLVINRVKSDFTF